MTKKETSTTDFLYSRLYKEVTSKEVEEIDYVHTLLWELLNFHPESMKEVVSYLISVKAKYNKLKRYD